MTESGNQQDPNQNGSPQNAGQVIMPGGAVSPAGYPQQQTVAAQPEQNPIAFTPSEDDPYAPQYTGAPEDVVTDEEAITWTASEFIAHEKNSAWYFNVIVAGVGISSVIFLITRSFVSTGAIFFIFMVFAFYGSRQPRQLPYKLDRSGLQIGERHFDYGAFKSFSVMPEGAFSSITLVPHRRFAPLTSIYYAPNDEDRIVAMLSAHLPYEDRKHDPIDRLMQRIRF